MGTRRKSIAIPIALASACLAATAASRAGEITLYSTREAALVAPVAAAFTEASGIKVKIVLVGDSLVERLASEGEASPADVLLTIGLDKTIQLATSGRTQVFTSPRLEQAVPANLQGGSSQWIALAIRPRVVMARNDNVITAIDYEDLAGAQWRGKLCMRSLLHQNNVALVAAYLAHHGEAATEAWLAGLKANLAHKPDGKDNDVVREIAQGTCEIGIGNTVALAQLRDGREGADWRNWAMAVKAVPTTFKGGGTHVNLTGVAIAKYAPHMADAQKFMEFLVTPPAQRMFAAAELEFPVMATAECAPIVAEMGSFTADALPIDVIGRTQQAAIGLIKKAGFDG
ncbi:extracellular solute-binding protein [Bradyrhizobium monzae]|uniref:extracellular solute-binding protein n=1 Tax=Bradyrhizobium sp. Oc8 TaxID=2876780 RepID=UPI001F3F1AD8|nr:extracellular solute-binding protein [Bradyrhizobium sp. Oc8]